MVMVTLTSVTCPCKSFLPSSLVPVQHGDRWPRLLLWGAPRAHSKRVPGESANLLGLHWYLFNSAENQTDNSSNWCNKRETLRLVQALLRLLVPSLPGSSCWPAPWLPTLLTGNISLLYCRLVLIQIGMRNRKDNLFRSVSLGWAPGSPAWLALWSQGSPSSVPHFRPTSRFSASPMGFLAASA